MRMRRTLLPLLLLFAMLFNLLPATAAPSADSQSIIPVKSFSPSGSTVRPDTPIVIYLDTEDPNWKRVENQFQTGNFSVTLNDTEIPATYDPVTASITATPGVLDRYTTYNFNILIKSNRNGNAPTKPALTVPIGFQTGSAIGEATTGRIIVDNPNPRVTETAHLTVEILDDYGNLSTETAGVSLALTESGNRLPQSAVLTPADLTAITGRQSFELTDKEAESVLFTVQVSSRTKQFSLSTTVTFRPGPAAQFDATYSNPVVAGTNNSLLVTVTDIYGNRVEDGETVTLTLPWNNTTVTSTTSGGQVTIPYTAPTKTGDYQLVVAANGQSQTLPLTVIADVPANMSLKVILPPNAVDGKVPADGISAAKVVATVTDRYGNPASGTINWTRTLGALTPAQTVLQNGTATVQVTSLIEGISTVTAQIGNLSGSVTVPFAKPASKVELGPVQTVPGLAEGVGFTINSDGKFWFARNYLGDIYTTVLNPDGTIYQKDVKMPHTPNVVMIDYAPTILARNDGYSGKVDYFFTRWYQFKFNLMHITYSSKVSYDYFSYFANSGDNREPFVTKDRNGFTSLVWNRNGGIYIENYSWINTTLRGYEPAVAYDSKYSYPWLFWKRDGYTAYGQSQCCFGNIAQLVYLNPIDLYLNKEPQILEPTGDQPATISTTEIDVILAYRKTDTNEIVIRTIKNGTISPATVVASGSSPVFSKDSTGRVWLAWVESGNVKYAPLNFN